MTAKFSKGLNAAALLLFFAILSCKKSGTPNPTPPNNTNTKTDTSTHVYIAGTTGTVALFSAALWKDGVLTNLVTDLTKNSAAYGIATLDTNVYACGFTSGDIATYWRNGTPNYLNDGQNNSASISGISFSGTDLYTVGNETIAANGNFSVAMYWKNGSGTPLIGNILSSNAGSIFFNENDIYISGGYTDKNHNNYPVYWENGTIQNLSIDITGNNPAFATGVVVLGTDVYACGYVTAANGNRVAAYWKNGTEVKLTDASTIANATASCIAVSGQDVYIGGTVTGIATYWKNGVATQFNTASSEIRAICIHKNDIYFAGDTYNPANSTYTPAYWKNGKIYTLPGRSTTSIAYGIAVTGGQ